tara:strand:- start:2137 stop:2382 length:246 start_codon:yes stop_codon:yes gene_type:complete
MAPYNPPNTHYSQLDVSEYEDKIIKKVVGRGGRGLYRLTKELKLRYIWHDRERDVIELWGPYESLRDGAKEKMEMEFVKYI